MTGVVKATRSAKEVWLALLRKFHPIDCECTMCYSTTEALNRYNRAEYAAKKKARTK